MTMNTKTTKTRAASYPALKAEGCKVIRAALRDASAWFADELRAEMDALTAFFRGDDYDALTLRSACQRIAYANPHALNLHRQALTAMYDVRDGIA